MFCARARYCQQQAARHRQEGARTTQETKISQYETLRRLTVANTGSPGNKKPYSDDPGIAAAVP